MYFFRHIACSFVWKSREFFSIWRMLTLSAMVRVCPSRSVHGRIPKFSKRAKRGVLRDGSRPLGFRGNAPMGGGVWKEVYQKLKKRKMLHYCTNCNVIMAACVTRLWLISFTMEQFICRLAQNWGRKGS